MQKCFEFVRNIMSDNIIDRCRIANKTDASFACALLFCIWPLQASRGRGLRQEADTLEASMTKLYKALNDERIRPSESKDSRFSELLAEVEKKHKQSAESELVDAMKEVIENLAEAREEKDDMGAVLSHLKSAVSKMNSIAVEKNKHRGLQEDASALENGAEPVTSAADFRQAMQCAATAARVNDIGAFLSCTQTIKQGVQAAILKVKNALDTIPSGELEELLAKRLSEANQDVAAVEDPVATASVAAATIGQLLDDSVSSLGVVGDFLMLLWIGKSYCHYSFVHATAET